MYGELTADQLAAVLELPDDARVKIVIFGRLLDVPVRDVRQAKDCEFSNCKNRQAPCSQHPRTEWGR